MVFQEVVVEEEEQFDRPSFSQCGCGSDVTAPSTVPVIVVFTLPVLTSVHSIGTKASTCWYGIRLNYRDVATQRLAAVSVERKTTNVLPYNNHCLCLSVCLSVSRRTNGQDAGEVICASTYRPVD